MHDRGEGQLELFDLNQQPVVRPHRESVGHWFFQLRYDQLVLAGIGGLLALTVVFACGVERGKQLARVERSLLAKQPEPSLLPSRGAATSEAPAVETTVQASPLTKGDEKKGSPTPSLTPKLKPPKRVAADAVTAAPKTAKNTSRFAIQLATYSKPQFARQELARLQAKGERAFLLIRDGRTGVYVGPFESRGHAGQKVTALKTHYRDCFVKTL